MQDKPFISIIVPVRNVQDTIYQCINSILELNYPTYEIIIINDGSTDDTGKIINNFKIQSSKFGEKIKEFKVIETTGVGPSKARNLAIKESKGEFVAFTDGDCILDKEWLNNLLEGFSNDKILGVGGIQLSPEDETEFGKMVSDFMNSVGFFIDYIKLKTDKGYLVDHNPSCNVMYKKEIFNKIDGFREGLWPGEDVEFDYRIKKLGYKLFFNPKAIVYHYRAKNIYKFIKMMFNYGKAQGILARTYGFFRRIHFVPIIFFPLLIIFLITTIFSLKLGLGLVLLFLNILFLYAIFRTKSFLEWLRFTVLLIITIFMWNIGFVVGLFREK